MEDPMNSITGRVNDLEKDLHNVKYRVNQLEHLPPKVSELERDFSVMDTTLTSIKENGAETRNLQVELNNNQKKLMGKLESYPVALRLFTGLIVLGGVGVSVVLWFQ
jgi:hypothetical protein